MHILHRYSIKRYNIYVHRNSSRFYYIYIIYYVNIFFSIRLIDWNIISQRRYGAASCRRQSFFSPSPSYPSPFYDPSLYIGTFLICQSVFNSQIAFGVLSNITAEATQKKKYIMIIKKINKKSKNHHYHHHAIFIFTFTQLNYYISGRTMRDAAAPYIQNDKSSFSPSFFPVGIIRFWFSS